ncbi:permease [Candidatus Woesearchaeota archaeon]|nr:permease [Candidatus Woesearchaeota archaeon]
MLKEIIEFFVYSILRLDPGVGEILSFFLYDSIKILLLLFTMISVIGFLRSYIPPDKVKRFLSGKRLGFGNLLASLFGAVTPFCTCSSIPIFLGFLEAGVPLGITFSFLITSPIINEYLVVLMLGFFGWKIALAYVLSGVIIGVISGLMLGRMNLERYLVRDLDFMGIEKEKSRFRTVKDRIIFGFNESKSIVKKLWLWVLLGVAVGAVIHNYVPQEFIQKAISATGLFGVPIAVLLGVPMYGSCAAIVPIAVVLFQKGVPLGTALSFMMAISSLSLPEAIILRRAMKLKLIAIFFVIVSIGIILTGYLFNELQAVLA